MDAQLEATVDALLNPGQVAFSLERPPPAAEPGEQELFFGVGQRAEGLPPHPRMLSWKLPQWRNEGLRSTTEAVLRSGSALDALAASLGAHAPGALPAPLTFRIHTPTLDTGAACLLAAHRLLHRAWPKGAKELSEYVSSWEQGRIEEAGTYESALASAYYALLSVFRAEGPTPPRELFELLARALGASSLSRLSPELIPARVARRLKADEALYRAELSRARLLQLDLPLDQSPDAPCRRVDAMFLSSPQDVTLLKLLARPDTAHSHYGAGFDVLVLHAPTEANAWARHTITLAPERPGALSDLAQLLDQMEGESAPDGAPRQKGTRRFPNQPNDYADPWYSDGYAWPKGRSTLVAPPFAGTRLSREQLWEAVFERFHPGRNVKVLEALTLFARPYRALAPVDADALRGAGWQLAPLSDAGSRLLPTVAQSFLGNHEDGDVKHLARPHAGRTAHLSLYPNGLVLAWVEVATKSETTLLQLAHVQAHLCGGEELAREFDKALVGLEPLLYGRWQVYGSYRLDRARSTMLDGCASVVGLFHALASGLPPTLRALPSDSAAEGRRVFKEAQGDVEHWFTPAGGARLELCLERPARPLALDLDCSLFLMTLGQRYSVLELSRKLGEVERAGRRSRMSSLKPVGDVRGDIMFFTNSLWCSRASWDADVQSRYQGWHALSGMEETLTAMREQTEELDSYRRERFEGMVGAMVFLFLPVTIVCGFFSGAQFSEMSLSSGVPGSTGGWVLFLVYLAVFTVLVFGAWFLGRLLSWRGR